MVIPNRINRKYRITFIFQTLAFSTPRLLSSFVSTAFEDVLSGLPTLRQPYVHELRWGPSRARCSWSSRVPCLHRSDRSAKPVRPVRLGFSLCWSFWRSSHVLTHSGVFGAILSQQYYVNSHEFPCQTEHSIRVCFIINGREREFTGLKVQALYKFANKLFYSPAGRE